MVAVLWSGSNGIKKEDFLMSANAIRTPKKSSLCLWVGIISLKNRKGALEQEFKARRS